MQRIDDDAPPPERIELLTSYLDGELDAEARSRVEAQLSADPAWAAELRRLERAWDLLDDLPRAQVDAGFTQSTVEMIALSAAAELQSVEQPPPARRWVERLTHVGAVVAALVGGYLFVDVVRPKRDDALLRALPVLRYFDVYSRTEPGESIEFIRQWHAAKIDLPAPPKPAP